MHGRPDLWTRTDLTAMILNNLKGRKKLHRHLRSECHRSWVSRKNGQKVDSLILCLSIHFLFPWGQQGLPFSGTPCHTQKPGDHRLPGCKAGPSSGGRQDPLPKAWVPVSRSAQILDANIIILIVHQHPRLLLSVSQLSVWYRITKQPVNALSGSRSRQSPKPQPKALLRPSTLQIPIRNQWKWSCFAHSVLQGSVWGWGSGKPRSRDAQSHSQAACTSLCPHRTRSRGRQGEAAGRGKRCFFPSQHLKLGNYT